MKRWICLLRYQLVCVLPEVQHDIFRTNQQHHYSSGPFGSMRDEAEAMSRRHEFELIWWDSLKW